MHLAVIAMVVWVAAFVWVWPFFPSEYIPGYGYQSLIDRAGATLFWWLAIGLWVWIVTIPTFTVSQALLAMVLCLWRRRRSVAYSCGLPVAVLMLSWLSFTCYDYLVPTFRWYTDTDDGWVHGLTMQRLLPFIGIQSCLSLFSLWRLTRQSLIP